MKNRGAIGRPARETADAWSPAGLDGTTFVRDPAAGPVGDTLVGASK
jgi:hypothetical protein